MKHTQIAVENLEKIIIEKFAEENKPITNLIRQQYEKASVSERRFTGVGFFTDFDVPDNIPKIEWPTRDLQTWFGLNINNIYHGFILFLEDGKINCLEAYSLSDGLWKPKIILRYQFSQTSSKPLDNKSINNEYQVELENFTKIIIEKLAKANKYFKDEILQQFDKARIGTITFTGKNFYIHFFLPDDIETINASVIESNKINIKIDEKNTDYILFLENGKIHTLTGVVCDGPWWPEITVNCTFLKD